MFTMRMLLVILMLSMCSAEPDWSRLTEFTDEVAKCYGIAGMSVSVTDVEETLYAQGFGYQDIAEGTRVDENTLFSIASTTKAFSTTLLSMLQDRGFLDQAGLDTKISTIIPGFVLNDTAMSGLVNIRDLVSHKTGVPRNDFMWQSGYARKNGLTRADLVRRIQWFPSEFEARSRYLYNNWMYMTAGHVAERLTGDTWEDMIEQNILSPNGMTNTFTSIEHAIATGRYATPYGQAAYGAHNEALPLNTSGNFEIFGPTGSLISSASDIPKWIRFHLREGVTDEGERLISSDVLRATYRPEFSLQSDPSLVLPAFPVEQTSWAYGLGWQSGTYRGYRVNTHGGRAMGHRARLSVVPGLRVGFFSTGSGGLWHDHTTVAFRLIENYALDLLLGLEPWLNASYACGLTPGGVTAPESSQWSEGSAQDVLMMPAERLAVRSSTCEQVAAFEGTYVHPGHGHLEVSASACTTDAVQLTLTYGDLVVILTPDPSVPNGFLGAFQKPLLLYYAWRGNAQPATGTVFSDNSVLLPWMEKATPPTFYRV